MKADPFRAACRAYLEQLPAGERSKFLADFTPLATTTDTGLRSLLTTAEACDFLRCKRTSLFRAERDQGLRAVYFRGRKLYRRADLESSLRGKVA